MCEVDDGEVCCLNEPTAAHGRHKRLYALGKIEA